MSSLISLKGKIFPLRFTVNALCDLEEKAGLSLDQLLKTGFLAVRGLLWCGLRDHMPALSLQEAGEMLEDHLAAGGRLHQVADELSSALADAGFFHQGEGENPRPSL